MPSTRATAAALTVLAAFGFPAACSRSGASGQGAVTAPTAPPTSTATATGPTAAGPPLGPSCTIATAALVSGKLGFPLTGPNVDRGPAVTTCTYDNPSNQTQSATVQIRQQATPASFAAGRNGFASHGEQVVAVAGVGDEAYSATLSMANLTDTTLVARQGTEEILITTTAPADRVRALMTAILSLV